MIICGFHSGHECSYFVMEDGKPIIHAELERYIRQKEPFGDGLELLFKDYPMSKDIQYFTHTLCTWKGGIRQRHPDTYKKMWEIITKNNGNFFVPGHHEAHAASAFFTSKFEHATIVTLDGGGREYVGEDVATATCSIWNGNGNKIEPVGIVLDSGMNIGAFWSSVTRAFGLNTGFPYGHQAGSVMAMAALGDKKESLKYRDKILTANFLPWNFDFKQFEGLEEQEKFNVARGLQDATTQVLLTSFSKFPKQASKNLCLSGGVALNSVLVGKIVESGLFENVYVDPVPYDGGLPIGSAYWVYHQVLDQPRVDFDGNFSPYLGKSYYEEDVANACQSFNEAINKEFHIRQEDIVDLLDAGKIVAIFKGKSESGRRALGNRSILADPRSPDMKDMINHKVKHRQWYRPFAPSIKREAVKDWFDYDVDSPYMSVVLKFREDKKDLVPAVVHFDGTARLQTVTEKDNYWYYNLLDKFEKQTGIPILLNTSFNDREPIVETPYDAINCFLGTEIDFLYFVEDHLLISRK